MGLESSPPSEIHQNKFQDLFSNRFQWKLKDECPQLHWRVILMTDLTHYQSLPWPIAEKNLQQCIGVFVSSILICYVYISCHTFVMAIQKRNDYCLFKESCLVRWRWATLNLFTSDASLSSHCIHHLLRASTRNGRDNLLWEEKNHHRSSVGIAIEKTKQPNLTR